MPEATAANAMAAPAATVKAESEPEAKSAQDKAKAESRPDAKAVPVPEGKADIKPDKAGQTGPLVFVKVHHEIAESGLVLLEDQG